MVWIELVFVHMLAAWTSSSVPFTVDHLFSSLACMILLLGAGYFRPCLVRKIFQDSPSHRILRHMHGALNIHEKTLRLHGKTLRLWSPTWKDFSRFPVTSNWTRPYMQRLCDCDHPHACLHMRPNNINYFPTSWSSLENRTPHERRTSTLLHSIHSRFRHSLGLV